MNELFSESEVCMKSPEAKRREQFVREYKVETHFDPSSDLPWAAWVGDFEYAAEFCAVMVETGELRLGKTKREAIDELAHVQGFALNELEAQL